MSDNKKIDDYYAIQSAEEPVVEKKPIKKKVIVKKAIKVKKVETTPEIASPETAEDRGDAPKIEKVKKVKKVQKITVVSQKETPSQTSSHSPSKVKTSETPSVDMPKEDTKKPAGFKKKKELISKLPDEDDTPVKKAFKKDRFKKYSKNISLDDDGEVAFSFSSKVKPKAKKKKDIADIVQDLTDHTGGTVIIPEVLSIKELSEKIGVPFVKLIPEFMKNGMKVTINTQIDFESAAIIAEAFEITLQKDRSTGVGVEEILSGDMASLLGEEDPALLVSRPPVVSIMGHVDHGKTSLLDYIRHTKVALKEEGGITQSIGAYMVDYNGKSITFLDTPGHEAFTLMRARGAKSTDIAILVCAADEGVKPQTIESINHAKEAGLKIVVAITKIDKEGANIDHVKSGLSSHELIPEDWGGDTPMIGVSSKTGQGIDELLEILLLVAELEEYKANPDRFALGTVIESHLDTKLGAVSTVLINTGTLKKGDAIVCKESFGKVKLLKSDLFKNIDSATPSMPVLVVGLDRVCEGGDIIQVVSDVENARKKAQEYANLMHSKESMSSTSLEVIMSKIKSGNLKQLKIVLKSDTNGSLEAIKSSLLKLSTPETKVEIIHAGVGNITESDILMCQGSGAILVGFNVESRGNTQMILEDTKVELISSKVIYHIIEKIEKIITGMLDPKEIEITLGEAKVGGIFYEGKGFMIIGLKLGAGHKIENDTQARIIRKDKYLATGSIDNLKSGIVDVNELEGPVECGIKLKTDVKIELGDILEIYKIHKES